MWRTSSTGSRRRHRRWKSRSGRPGSSYRTSRAWVINRDYRLLEDLGRTERLCGDVPVTLNEELLQLGLFLLSLTSSLRSSGVPAVVDFAAMRDAVKTLGGDPEKINPVCPADLVIDHSIQVDFNRK